MTEKIKEEMEKEMLSILTALYKMEPCDLCTFDVRDHEFRNVIADVIRRRGELSKELQDDWIAYQRRTTDIVQKTRIGKKWANRKLDLDNGKRDFDYDASLFSNCVYRMTIFSDHPECLIRHSQGYEYVLQSGDSCYRGDTMNSWQTTLNKFDEVGHWPVYPAYVTEFMNVVYTIGNFIPVPLVPSFNKWRNSLVRDYWDLTLRAIYRLYTGGLPGKFEEENWDKWRKLFEDEKIELWLGQYGKGQQGWDNFVERNFLQDFVGLIEGGGYGKPKELWKGHFTGNVKPTQPQQFEQFFTNASSWILARGNRIAIAVGKKNEQELKDMAGRMMGDRE